MNKFIGTFSRWLLGVGFLVQIIFFTQLASAINVGDLALAPSYKSQDGKPLSKNRKNFILRSENARAENRDFNSPEDSNWDGSAPDLETSQTNEKFEDPFDTAIPELPDPYEKHNRFIFDLNNKVYNYFTRHVAEGYRFVVPYELRIVVRNIFNNAAMPVNLVSSLIQGNMDKSGRVVSRFLINSTAGLGGMLDVAYEEYDIEPVFENMSQALGHYDVPTGPYLVIPLFGPSSVRNLVGRTADIFVSPAFLLSAPLIVNSGIATGKKVNETSFLVKTKKELEQDSLDEYESVRDFYKQYHYRLVKD